MIVSHVKYAFFIKAYQWFTGMLQFQLLFKCHENKDKKFNISEVRPRKGRTYEKGSKDLNVPDKAHPVEVVLIDVDDTTIAEVHVPSVVGNVL